MERIKRALFRIGVKTHQEENDQDHDRDITKISPDFFTLQGVFPFSTDDQVPDIEIDTEQDHPDGDQDLAREINLS